MERRRMLFVHAHPDDESIGTGATMAKYAAEGAHVTLVTCTLGELGEIIPPGLAALAADRDDQLGGYRIGELGAACRALGVGDHRFLGGPGRWRDSGMIGTPGNDDPRAFWQADVDEAARDLAAVIREVRPQVMVTYDDDGFYGHPDHIQAHRVSYRAYQLAADPAVILDSGGCDPAPPWQVSKFYASTTPQSQLDQEIEMLQAVAPGGSGAPGGTVAPGGSVAQRLPSGFRLPASAADLVYGVPDEQVTTEIDASCYLDAKLAAMRAHATQISVEGTFFALSNQIAQLASGVEYYALLAGEPGPEGPYGREDDLFAGIAADPQPQRIPDGAAAGHAG
ncbi:MAG: N-acetyl-1-D-myo-inositol-2-amino-2-deoxy-alpha-D-glucopyranoside deacetylase [Streptosporangiaceae bacterium]